jgi:large subunit ribosomal protein L20
MPRVKTGFVRRRKHNKVKKLVKGQWGSRGRLWKRSKEAMIKSLFYSYRDRRQKRRQLRTLWIARMNAACSCSWANLQSFDSRLKPSAN